MTQDYNNYYHIKSNYMAGYVVSDSACVLKGVIINCSTAVVIGVIDTTVAAGISLTSSNMVAKLWKTPTTGSYLYNCVMKHGITVIVSGASDITPDLTVVYRK